MLIGGSVPKLTLCIKTEELLISYELLNLNNESRDDFAQHLAEFLSQLLSNYDISRSSEKEALFKSFHSIFLEWKEQEANGKNRYCSVL